MATVTTATTTIATSTKPTTSSTSLSTKPIPAPWDLVVEAKRREADAHKVAERAMYDAWIAEANIIRTALDDGKAKHCRVMMFNMNDAKRERILTFQLGEVRDGKIVVSFQGVVGRLKYPRCHLSKNQRAFNRLIALRRLRDFPRTFTIDVPETWNTLAYDRVREHIRKGIFGGLK